MRWCSKEDLEWDTGTGTERLLQLTLILLLLFQSDQAGRGRSQEDPEALYQCSSLRHCSRDSGHDSSSCPPFFIANACWTGGEREGAISGSVPCCVPVQVRCIWIRKTAMLGNLWSLKCNLRELHTWTKGERWQGWVLPGHEQAEYSGGMKWYRSEIAGWTVIVL